MMGKDLAQRLLDAAVRNENDYGEADTGSLLREAAYALNPAELWKQLYAHWLGMDEDETTLTCACGERFSADNSKPEDWAKHVAAALG